MCGRMASCADDEVLELLDSTPLPGRSLSAKQMWPLLHPSDKSFIVHCLFAKRDVQDPNAFVCSFYSKLPQKPALPAQRHRPAFKAAPAPWAWVMQGSGPRQAQLSSAAETPGPPSAPRCHEIGTAVVGMHGGIWYPGAIVSLRGGAVEVLWANREDKRETAVLSPDSVRPAWELVR